MAKQATPKRPKQPTAPLIPTPFTTPSPTLSPFLEQLDPSLVYITHIDVTPPETKKSIFLIPVLLNASIAALLLWRLYAAAPVYWAIAQALVGYQSSAYINVLQTSRSQQIWVLAKRVLMFAIDFLVFRFIGPWPTTFFLEQPANPVTWRWKLGFREKEVVVRVSRGWGTEDLMKGVRQGEENAFFKTRIMPAIDRVVMRKTGYLLMDKSWDLDFQLMLDAHTLLKDETIKMEALDKLVLAYMDEGIGWVVWRWESESDVIEDRRKKVVLFKEKLTKMGKEGLFWKWMEIVEDERDADGGFTAERQEKVAGRVQREFEKEGVDFEGLTESVGGLDELPVTGT